MAVKPVPSRRYMYNGRLLLDRDEERAVDHRQARDGGGGAGIQLGRPELSHRVRHAVGARRHGRSEIDGHADDELRPIPDEGRWPVPPSGSESRRVDVELGEACRLECRTRRGLMTGEVGGWIRIRATITATRTPSVATKWFEERLHPRDHRRPGQASVIGRPQQEVGKERSISATNHHGGAVSQSQHAVDDRPVRLRLVQRQVDERPIRTRPQKPRRRDALTPAPAGADNDRAEVIGNGASRHAGCGDWCR